MTKRGKSLNLFLMDGTPNGIIKCTIANWTCVFSPTLKNIFISPQIVSKALGS